jgi:hypothetical protein
VTGVEVLGVKNKATMPFTRSGTSVSHTASTAAMA